MAGIAPSLVILSHDRISIPDPEPEMNTSLWFQYRLLRLVAGLCGIACVAVSAFGVEAGEPWWTWRNPLPQGNQFTDVAFADGTYVAVGRGGTIFTSSDAVNWVSRVSGVGEGVRFVVRGNGLWLAAAGEQILTSTDGTTWFVSPATPGLDDLGHVVFFGGRFLASGWRGRIWSSVDGVQWTIAYSQTGAYFTGIAAGGGRVIAVGNLQGKVCAVTSTDGTTWTDTSAAMSGLVTDSFASKPIVFVNERWFLLGSDLKTSTDGVTWTTLNAGFAPNDIGFGGGRYVCAVSGSAAVSTDLSTWTTTPLPVLGGAREARAVVFGPIGFVIVGAGGFIGTSSDGANWVNRCNNKIPDNLRRIAYADGRWLVAGEAGVYSSPDGVAWSTAASFAEPSWGNAAVVYGGGIALAAGGGSTLLRSTDRGVTWATVASGPGSLSEMAFGDGRFVGVAAGRRLVSSTDGITWTEGEGLPASGGPSFNRLVCHAGRWIAQGVRWALSGEQDQPVFAVSSDGINWDLLPEGTFPARSYAIAEGGGLVVACPYSGVTPWIYTSTDGLAWTQTAKLSSAVGPVMALGHTESGFVGMTAFGYTVFSSDGQTWTTTASTGEFIYNDVAEGGGSVLAVGNNSVILQSSASRFVNNSTRAATSNSEDVLIAGFVLTGSEPTKRVLIRGIGPSLTDYAVDNVLADPELVLFRGQDVVARNIGWSSAPNADAIATVGSQVGAFALRNDRADSALLVDLAPGVYTAHVRSAGGRRGVALAEVYEVGQTRTRLINLSTRALVGTGSSVVIPGMVIGGESPRRVLIRAVGPTLRQYGVNAALERPTMSLVLGQRTVASNTEWGTAENAAAMTAAAVQVGAFALPAGSKDSALLVTLNPGIYTTVVQGVDGTGGVALVEVYEVQ